MSSGTAKTESRQDMIPVSISDFIMGDTMPVNVYVRIGQDKFVLVARPGDKTDTARLSTYKNKAVDYLWVKKTQYGELVKTGLQIAGIIIQKDILTGGQKTKLLTQAAGPVFRQMDASGISFETYSHAKQIVEVAIAIVEHHRDLSEILENLAETADEILRHSLAVSCVSTLIGQAMKWDSRSTIEKLALGALLHDIGKKALPPDLLKKAKPKMTFDETQLYEQHAYKGMQMLLALGTVPDDVISIVYEHHENAIGQGFPRRLRNLKIHPLARVVSLANEFVNLTMPNVNHPAPKNPREALMVIEHTMGQPYNRDAFRALQLVVAKDYKEKAG
jgi:putative nucleotidyltransferase with HDIG domain